MNRKLNSKWLVRVGLVSACTLTVVLLLVSWAKRTRAQSNAQVQVPVHMTTDWSNRHMVYSAPSSMAEAWRLQAEPRYLHQYTRRAAPALQAQSGE
jgi:hypothetical protein